MNYYNAWSKKPFFIYRNKDQNINEDSSYEEWDNFYPLVDRVKEDTGGKFHIYHRNKVGQSTFYKGDTKEIEQEPSKNVTTVIIHPDEIFVGEDAFLKFEQLDQVIFHSQLGGIGKAAFHSSGIKGMVFLPIKVKIEEHTFYDCKCLTEVVYGGSLNSKVLFEYFGARSFSGSGIRRMRVFAQYHNTRDPIEHGTLAIPSTVTIIKEDTFFGCEYVTKVEFHDNINEIGKGCFSGTKIEEVAIPPKVNDIEARIFQNCLKLRSVEFHPNIRDIDDYAFCRSGIEKVTIPPKVADIQKGIFEDCKKLTSVVFHENIRDIHEDAFHGSGITEVTIPPRFNFQVLHQTFRKCPNLKTIKFCNKNDKNDIIGEVSIAMVEDRDALLKKFDRYKKPIDILSRFGASLNSIKIALEQEVDLKDTPFDKIFEKHWEDAVEQLECLRYIPRLMSPAYEDALTKLLSNEAINLFGPKPYPGVSEDNCFKMVCFIDISSLKCINTTFKMAEGTKAIKQYAKEIDRVLQKELKSFRTKDRKLYGTTHRKGGDEYVIIITGVLSDPESADVPKEIQEIYDTVIEKTDSLVSIDYVAPSEKKYGGETVPTFLRIGCCWCKMNFMEVVEGQEQKEKDIHPMIDLAEILQEIVKKEVGLDRNDAKSLEEIRENGKKNYSALIEYNATNVGKYKKELEDQKENDTQKMESYMGRGQSLADGYFLNFLEEIATDICNAKESASQINKKGIHLSVFPKPELNTSRKVENRLLIIVPSQLDWDKDDPIVDFIEESKGDNFKGCEIKKAGNDNGRIKQLNVIIIPDSEEAIIIDIPTTFSSLLRSIKRKCETSTTTKIDKNKKLAKLFHKEVDEFIKQIIYDLEEHGLDKVVTVVKIDKLDKTFFKKIQKVNVHLNKAAETGSSTSRSSIITVMVKPNSKPRGNVTD